MMFRALAGLTGPDQYGQPLEWLESAPLDPGTATAVREWLDRQGRNAQKILKTPRIAGVDPAPAPETAPVLFTIHPRPPGGPAGYIVCRNYPTGDREPVGVAYSLTAARTIIPTAYMAHPARSRDLFVVHADPQIGTVPLTQSCPADKSLLLLSVVLDETGRA